MSSAQRRFTSVGLTIDAWVTGMALSAGIQCAASRFLPRLPNVVHCVEAGAGTSSRCRSLTAALLCGHVASISRLR